MTDLPENAELLDFLAKPEAYGLGAREKIRRIDTHASHVFLAGERAYKMKKPVRFTFLDFSTLKKRKLACEREVELNRRTAPDFYLGVVPVRRVGRDFRFGGDEGEIAEYLVEMKRFGDEGLLATLAEKGELTLPPVEELAGAVAGFHRRAEVRRDFGGAEGTAKIVAGSEEDMKESIGPVLDTDAAREVTEKSRALISRHRALLDERREQGWVRHCHGDLHLGNVTMVDGRPVIFDCVEFSDHIARIDTLYDLAFLLMDLAFRGERDERLGGFANRALNVYLDHLTMAEIDAATRGLALLPLFVSMRAVVRAKVTAVQAKGGNDEKRDLARAYLDYAVRALASHPARLVAVGGLSGTGKSTLAKKLAGRIGGAVGAVHLRTDTIRKRLFGVGPLDRLPDEAYARDAGERVYAEMMRLATLALDAGMSVVADAVFAREEERRAVAELASASGVPFDGLWLDAPASVLEARVAARERQGRDPSDAGVAVLKRQLGYDLGEMTWKKVDASGTPEQALAGALETIDMTPD